MDKSDKKRILLIGVSEEFMRKVIGVLDLDNFEILETSFYDNLLDKTPDLLIINNEFRLNSFDSFPASLASRLGEYHVPILFLTSDNIKPNFQSGEQQLAVDFIKQPVDSSELSSKVHSLLKRADILNSYGKPSQIEKALNRQSNKVLVVDDDAYLLKLFSYNFLKAGFEVKTASDGADGLKAAKEFEPDVIISDIMMPKMDGYEFRKLILSDPLLKTIPFVFLTAKGEEQDILEGYDLEIEDYIVKTSGPKVIVAKVSAILKSHEKERSKIVSEIHQAADSLRAKVVPENFPEFDGFQIKHWHLPYKGVPGGDFIDYFKLDEDNIVIVLGDVMGKKWGAWYFAFAYAGYVRSAIRVVLQSALGFSPGKLLQKINESVYRDAKVSEVFTTLSVIIIDRKMNIAKYAGAGDLPVIHRNSTRALVEQKSSNGLLLGFSLDGAYEDTVINLDKGDTLLLFTDGVIESRNQLGQGYGMDRFISLIENLNPEEDPMDKIKEELTGFTSGNFDDDISLITIKADM